MELLVEQGFELVLNAQDSGEMSSASTNRLGEMYESYPTRIETYILGDGYYTDPNDGKYYMHIDIGYFRLIYYFGLLGLFFYLSYQYKLIKMMCDSYKVLSAHPFFSVAAPHRPA